MNYNGLIYNSDNEFIFGYGSTINYKSRNETTKFISLSIPVRISNKFGYKRCWNFQSPNAKLTALGIVKDDKNPSTINGVLFSVKKKDLNLFDKREEGYSRIQIPIHFLEPTSWCCLPNYNCIIWTYVPNNYNIPNKYYPILQSYIDVCINGALNYGKKFVIEFLNTTYSWNKYWLNDRKLARRPWIHEKNYKLIDKLLSKYPTEKKNYILYRKLTSEYSVYFSNLIQEID